MPVDARRIWVDADACPRAVKEILFRASRRTGIGLTLVANSFTAVPREPQIRSVEVEAGLDVADAYVVRQANAGDLVVTADIPLAAELVRKACFVLNPRGELYTEENVRERLNMRDFLDTLRGSGLVTGGPSVFSQADRKAFAAQLDRWLATG